MYCISDITTIIGGNVRQDKLVQLAAICLTHGCQENYSWLNVFCMCINQTTPFTVCKNNVALAATKPVHKNLSHHAALLYVRTNLQNPHAWPIWFFNKKSGILNKRFISYLAFSILSILMLILWMIDCTGRSNRLFVNWVIVSPVRTYTHYGFFNVFLLSFWRRV